MNKAFNLLNKILFYGFLLGGTILLFFDLGNALTKITYFTSFLASWGLSEFFKKKGIDKKYLLFVNILLWLNISGELTFYYGGIGYYDKALHLIVGLVITAILYDYYSKSLKIKGDMIFFTALGMLAIWEIYEYILVAFFNFPMMGVIVNGVVIQPPLEDTMIDLICGSIGSLVYLFFKKEKSKK